MSEQKASEGYPTTDVLICDACKKAITDPFVIDNTIKPTRNLHALCAAYEFGAENTALRARVEVLWKALRNLLRYAESRSVPSSWRSELRTIIAQVHSALDEEVKP